MSNISSADVSLSVDENGRAAVFFDRDGVLNVDTGYPHDPNKLRLIDGAAQTVAFAKKLGFLTIVVTNQSGVAKGLFGEDAVARFNARLSQELSVEGGEIDAFYICPYHPAAHIDRYRCDHPDRKPNPGMMERAIIDFSISRSASLLVGDKITDIQAAEAAGIEGHLFSGSNLFAFLSPFLSIKGTGNLP